MTPINQRRDLLRGTPGNRLDRAVAAVAHPAAQAEAPRLIFPFARRVLADAIRDGGFPPLLLDPIDFGSLYMQQAQQMQATAGEPAGHA